MTADTPTTHAVKQIELKKKSADPIPPSDELDQLDEAITSLDKRDKKDILSQTNGDKPKSVLSPTDLYKLDKHVKQVLSPTKVANGAKISRVPVEVSEKDVMMESISVKHMPPGLVGKNVDVQKRSASVTVLIGSSNVNS